MRTLTVGVVLPLALLAGAVAARPAQKGDKKVPAALRFTMKSIDGKDVDLAKYQGKVVLIVNVASECGYTPQYRKLQELYAKYGKDGLVILGIPSNEFGMQEPGSEAEIAAFCKKNYGVTFDLFAKVQVNGDGACPLYKHLTSKETNPQHAGKVRWNFEKFLLGRNGEVVARFASDVEPDSEEFLRAIRNELERR